MHITTFVRSLDVLRTLLST